MGENSRSSQCKRREHSQEPRTGKRALRAEQGGGPEHGGRAALLRRALGISWDIQAFRAGGGWVQAV